MLRAIVLVRVSTSKASQETSSERQLARLEEIAGRRRWTVVARFLDEESGTNVRGRRSIQDALELVRRKRADVVMVDHLFRFGRNAKEMLEAVDTLNQLGGALYEAEREIDTTSPVGRLMFTIFAAVGEFYARDNSASIRRGLERARARGARIGRPRTIDYSRRPEAESMKAGGATWDAIAVALGGSPGAWSRALSR